MLKLFYIRSIALSMSMTYPLLNKIQESKLVKGLTNMINDATTVAIALCGVVAGLCWVITSIRLQGADEQEAPALKKKLKMILIACVIGACGSIIIKLVLSYF